MITVFSTNTLTNLMLHYINRITKLQLQLYRPLNLTTR